MVTKTLHEVGLDVFHEHPYSSSGRVAGVFEPMHCRNPATAWLLVWT